LAHRDREEFEKLQNEFSNGVKLDVEARLREGVKAVLEEVLQEEMTEHLGAGHRESILGAGESAMATMAETSLLQPARSRACGYPETARASSSPRYSSATRGSPAT
jgi:hypothetical protein